MARFRVSLSDPTKYYLFLRYYKHRLENSTSPMHQSVLVAPPVTFLNSRSFRRWTGAKYGQIFHTAFKATTHEIFDVYGYFPNPQEAMLFKLDEIEWLNAHDKTKI